MNILFKAVNNFFANICHIFFVTLNFPIARSNAKLIAVSSR